MQAAACVRRFHLRPFALALATSLALVGETALAGPARALPEGQLPNDQRLQPLKDLDGYFSLEVADSPEVWRERAEKVRRQVKVALGLWPMPKKTLANAVIHGSVDRGDYTVERVYLESFPGHFVTGSLYRPKGRTGQLPGVLCPHGHWANGRFCDQGEASIKEQIASGAEKYESGRYHLQARCAKLARLGCVVFHYDMLGNADSQQIPLQVAHGFSKQRPGMDTPENWGFFSTQAELRLQHVMGLQTYNSIRALDWLSSLKDVDPKRIAVTGASGGGTQTFILCAVDPRPAVQFPAVMVSTAMQGGCTCENCTYLRVGTGNIELAGLFAPKPLAMSGADDWTKEIMTKGLPELKQLYRLMGAEDNVMAAAHTEFGHNYNYVSRADMYNWFNKHLQLGHDEPIIEEDFQPLTIEEMTVWDDQHPKPPAGEDYERSLLAYMTQDSDQQIAALTPTNASKLKDYRRVVGGAFEALIGRQVLPAGAIEFTRTSENDRGSYVEITGTLRNAAAGEELPVLFFHPHDWKGSVAIWIDEAGKSGLYASDGSLKAEIGELIASGVAVASVDLLFQGEFLADGQPPTKNRTVNTEREFAGFSYGYNYPLFAQRVQDILTLVSFVKHHEDQPKRIDLVGLDGAGPWVAAAASQAGSAVDRLVVDTQGFRFEKLTSFLDVNFLPGSVKYGDVPALLALSAPRAIWLAGEGSTVPEVTQAAYKSSGAADKLTMHDGDEDGEASAAVRWLLNP